MTVSDVRVRFAPSPTGLLHIGGLRTALYNYLVARRQGGVFVLRIEDTDRERYVEEAEEYIRRSLEWAGLQPDEGPDTPGQFGPYRQSERLERYRACAEQLLESGRAYRAFDSEDELEALRNRDGGNTRYDASTRMSMRNSLTLPEREIERLLDASVPYVVRLRVPERSTIGFNDLVRGEITFKSSEVDDQVLLKSDGYPTYHLANVVDDHEMRISHVIRGEEWLPSTPKHILLYEAFGWNPPQMAHLPLILSPTGGKLSKRSGERHDIPVFVLDYARRGYEPEAVLNYIALLGWHPGSDRERFSMDQLVETFSLDRVGSSSVQFDMDKLNWFNQQVLRDMPDRRVLESARPFLDRAGYSVADDYLLSAIELVRDRLVVAGDIVQYNEFFREPESYDEGAVRKRWKASTSSLVSSFAERCDSLDDWQAATLESMLETFVEDSDIGKGAIMPALRIALSGKASGPSLFGTMAILGKDTTVRRLRRAASVLSAKAATSG